MEVKGVSQLPQNRKGHTFLETPKKKTKKPPQKRRKIHLEIVKKTYSNSKKWQALYFLNTEKDLVSLPGVWDLDSGSTALNC